MTAKTEDQARLAWCPFTRFAETDRAPSSSNRDLDDLNPHYSRCIADDCMAWRWMRWDGLENSVERGYCGLAGKVEHL